jgi:N-acetylmuramoyl-L-alanine amidase
MIVSISFNPQIGLGSFRIEKGNQFSHFREERLNDPDRLVLNIYPKTGYRITSVGEIRSRNSDWGVEDSSTDDEDTPVGTIQDTRETGIVVVDPGHGGQDRGVDIRLTEAPEKTLNLQISLALEQELTHAGIANRLTRYRDVNLGTEQRSAVANYYEARLFIGIHIGASPSPETRGPVVYTYAPIPLEEDEQSEEDGDQEPEPKQVEIQGEALQPWQKGQIKFLPESRRLARRLQTSLNRVFESENSINAAPLEVLAPIQAPAVVIELGQLSNLEDRELLGNPDFIAELANVISDILSGFVPIPPEGASNP